MVLSFNFSMKVLNGFNSRFCAESLFERPDCIEADHQCTNV
ncbi:hypothetical protein S7335_4300 [Synechococcus sp. PCC 7335]|nr:hypothetical protein S7335_4300 [Synechococcus sp. PCC 7335]